MVPKEMLEFYIKYYNFRTEKTYRHGPYKLSEIEKPLAFFKDDIGNSYDNTSWGYAKNRKNFKIVPTEATLAWLNKQC